MIRRIERALKIALRIPGKPPIAAHALHVV
jgi:hypothetical protein